MVMEFASLGSLYYIHLISSSATINTSNASNLVSKEKVMANKIWQDKIKSLQNISKALYYLHDKNLIHQDFHEIFCLVVMNI